MSSEDTGRSEFTQLVSNHILGHIDGDEFVPVVNGDGEANEVGGNHRGAGPGLDGGLFARLLGGENALFQFVVDKGAFF